MNVASRRHGFNNSKLLLRRIRAKIGVQLVRRAVRMVQSCLPKLSSEEVSLLTGVDFEAGDFGGGDACDHIFEDPYPGGSRLNTITP